MSSAHPCSHLGIEGAEAEAGAGAMLVACRLAGLSALEAHYAAAKSGAQCGRTRAFRKWRPRPQKARTRALRVIRGRVAKAAPGGETHGRRTMAQEGPGQSATVAGNPDD